MVKSYQGRRDAILHRFYYFFFLSTLWNFPCQDIQPEKISIQQSRRSGNQHLTFLTTIQSQSLLHYKQVPKYQTQYFLLAHPPDNIAKISYPEIFRKIRYHQQQSNWQFFNLYLTRIYTTDHQIKSSITSFRLNSTQLIKYRTASINSASSENNQNWLTRHLKHKSQFVPLTFIHSRKMIDPSSPMLLEVISEPAQPSTKRKLHQDLPDEQEINISDPKIACYSEDNCTSEDASITEITWDTTMALIQPFTNVTATFPPFQSLLNHCGNLLVSHKADEQLERSRMQASVPDSLARMQFSLWSGQKCLGDLLTMHQLHTVGHFLTILQHEILREQQLHIDQDLQFFLDILAGDNPLSAIDTVVPALQDHYDGFLAETIIALNESIEQVLNQLTITVAADTDWTDRAPEALSLLIDLILVDSPELAQTSEDLDANSDELSTVPEPALPTKVTRLRTSNEISIIPDLQVCTKLTTGDVKMARDMITYCRSIDYTLATDATLGTHITTVTKADRSAVWARYIVILGFTPPATLNETIAELEALLQEWDPSSNNIGKTDKLSLLDPDWITARFYDNGWAISRDITSRDRRHGDHSNSGHILKLRKRSLFGTLHWNSTHSGNIRPIIYNIRNPNNIKRRLILYALPDPIKLQHVLQHQQFPILLAVRGAPVGRDKNALTAAYVFLLQQLVDKHLPQQCLILPTILYHEVVWSDSRRRRGQDRTIIHHPQLNAETKKANKGGFGELILTVIYCNTPSEVKDGLTDPNFIAARTLLTTALARPIHGEPQTTHPILINLSGPLGEGLLSLDECRQMPRRHRHIRKISPVCIHGLAPGMLAHDVLTILATNEYNRSYIRNITTAITLPEIPNARYPLNWRLCCYGIHDPTWLNMDPLNNKLRAAGIHQATVVTTNPIDGLQDYFALDELYEEYYAPRDKLLKTPSPSPAETPPLQPRIRVSNLSSKNGGPQQVQAPTIIQEGSHPLPGTTMMTPAVSTYLSRLQAAPDTTGSPSGALTKLGSGTNSALVASSLLQPQDLNDLIGQMVRAHFKEVQSEQNQSIEKLQNAFDLQTQRANQQFILDKEDRYLTRAAKLRELETDLIRLHRNRSSMVAMKNKPAEIAAIDQQIIEDTAVITEVRTNLAKLKTAILKEAAELQVTLAEIQPDPDFPKSLA